MILRICLCKTLYRKSLIRILDCLPSLCRFMTDRRTCASRVKVDRYKITQKGFSLVITIIHKTRVHIFPHSFVNALLVSTMFQVYQGEFRLMELTSVKPILYIYAVRNITQYDHFLTYHVGFKYIQSSCSTKVQHFMPLKSTTTLGKNWFVTVNYSNFN